MSITWVSYLYVALGGALGASLRLFTNSIVTNLLGKGFPFATLSVNVVGSFFLGIAYAWFLHNTQANSDIKLFVMVGFFGALTTFSTFSMEVFLQMQQGEWLKAGLTVILNVCLCLLAVWCAMTIMKG
ncbi:fluoride efflux transporter CrcB [Glaciecola siphonariae]|uniref:Fluoride-specific ion channel FluC n=1 Tax=Glaciecola siphonariae TaxID=521012 RepID=A0ABV9LU07_9ALTE